MTRPNRRSNLSITICRKVISINNIETSKFLSPSQISEQGHFRSIQSVIERAYIVALRDIFSQIHSPKMVSQRRTYLPHFSHQVKLQFGREGYWNRKI